MTLTRTALALILCLGLAPLARAQDPDLAQLEKRLREVAKASIPRTVLVKAIVDESRMGTGSGAIISEDGWILTCTHVVELGKRVEVVTSDGTSYPAKVVGLNKRQDYALVKVEAKGLDPYPIGDSKKLVPGDWVVALGHPGGPYPDLLPTFAAGQVRGKDAQLVEGMMGKFYDQAIVTDVPIFSGNSGGPLVNLDGELVGLNAAIIQINELAFAIPIHEVQEQLEALKAGQQLAGVQGGPEAWKKMQELISPEDMARMQKRMMNRLFDGGGKFADLFREFMGEDSPLRRLFGENGQPGEMPDLGKLMEDMFGQGGQPGEMPDLGQMMEELQKMLGEGQPGEVPDLGDMFRRMFGGDEDPQPGRPRGAPAPATGGFLGLRAAQGETPGGGVLVDDVVQDGPAARAGVKKGDLVRSIDGEALADFTALRAALADREAGEEIVLGIERAELEGTVLVHKQLEVRVTLGRRQ